MKRSRWLISLNVSFMIFLMAMIVLYVNYLSARHFKRFDLTQKNFYSISDKTKNILNQLDGPISVILVFDPKEPLYGHMLDLLEEYRYVSDLVLLEDVNPYRDHARTQELMLLYNIPSVNHMIVVHDKQHKLISHQVLADYDYGATAYGGRPVLKAFKGEQVLSSAILEVTQAEPMKIALSSGHGELDSDSVKESGSLTAMTVLKADNFLIESIPVLHLDRLEGFDLLVIAGPTKPFLSEELDVLTEYIETGGNILMLLDPLVENNLDLFLNQYDVELGGDIVVDPAKKLPYVNAANLVIDIYDEDHPVTKGMKGIATLFPLAQSVRVVKREERSGRIQTSVLAQTSPEGWGESKLNQGVFHFNKGEDTKGPVSVVLGLEVKTENGGESRMVIFGNSQFMMNTQINNLGNKEFLLNSVHWLLRKENLISITAKTPENAHLTMTAQEMSSLFWKFVLGIPISVLVVGGVVWSRRRN